VAMNGCPLSRLPVANRNRPLLGENGMAEMERREEVPIIAAATYYQRYANVIG
jgi:hypothetical protein